MLYLLLLVLGWAVAAPPVSAPSLAPAPASRASSAPPPLATPASPASPPPPPPPVTPPEKPKVVQAELQNVHSLASGPFLQLIKFALGNQIMTGVFDTGSSDVVAPVTDSILCKDPLQQCDSSAASKFVAGSFDPGMASARELGISYNHSFGHDAGVTGNYVETMAKVGDGEVSLQVAAINGGKLRQEEFLFSIFGVGPIQGEDSQPREYLNLPAKMKSAGVITSNVFSVWTNDFRTGNGTLVFGGVDLAKFEGAKLKFLPLERTLDGVLPAFVTQMSSVKFKMAKKEAKRSETVFARDNGRNNKDTSNHNRPNSRNNKHNSNPHNSNSRNKSSLQNANDSSHQNNDSKESGHKKSKNNEKSSNRDDFTKNDAQAMARDTSTNKTSNHDSKKKVGAEDNKNVSNNNNTQKTDQGNGDVLDNLVPNGGFALFETATSGMSLPKPALEAVAKMLNTSITKEGDLGLTDCGLINSESMLIFGFDDDRVKINVPLDTLSLPRQFLNGTDKCQLFIGTDEDELTILGAAFLQNVYVTFDMDRQAMHVAQAKVNVTESNVKEFKLQEHVEEPVFDDDKNKGGNDDKEKGRNPDDGNQKQGDQKGQSQGDDQGSVEGSSIKSFVIPNEEQEANQGVLKQIGRGSRRGGNSYSGSASIGRGGPQRQRMVKRAFRYR
ncbi:hypothetical protein CDD81_136 [Ophiocordyceps australis]|uniref:Peptidase A1 domain-containing protein n=1 Tax=Ophiocordyceps australis TaxID=1399860 RepID=A0A2C5XNA8_9HYPO|nr:hypothetical protein CDD81_136 [Ophiocordyceps australis]